MPKAPWLGFLLGACGPATGAYINSAGRFKLVSTTDPCFRWNGFKLLLLLLPANTANGSEHTLALNDVCTNSGRNISGA
jgi:hypothetical protein